MTLFDGLLATHIAGGGASLLVGGAQMVLPKGDLRHRRLGRVYFWSLLVASLVALPMSYLHDNAFLFIVGVFTAFMLLSGLRYLGLAARGGARPADWVLTATMAVFGLAFLGYGTYGLSGGDAFGWVLLAFGAISVLFVRQDLNNYRGRSLMLNYGLTTHLQRMVGSYIASVTAFVVVNVDFLPAAVVWLAPTVVLTPLIVVWSRRWGVVRGEGR